VFSRLERTFKMVKFYEDNLNNLESRIET